MTRDSASSPTRRLPRAAKWAGIVLLVLLALLLALYLAAPVVVAALSPYLAQQFGLTSLTLAIERPGLDGIRVDTFVALREDVELRGTDVRLDYSWSQLRRGRVDRLVVATLDVVLLPSQAPHAPDDDAGDAAVIPAVPVETLRIDQLTVRLPETGFVGSGHATLDAQGLSLSLAGQAPEAASRLFVSATLSRDGALQARLGEQDSDDPPFLTLRGDIAGSALGLTGEVRLAGYPLTLAAAIAGAPQGSGQLTGTVTARLPRPLPDNFSWRQLDATVDAFAIDWGSADGAIALEGVAGSASLGDGEVELRLNGAAVYRGDGRETTLRFPEDYRLHSQAETFAGAEGVRLTHRQGDTSATLTTRSLQIKPGTTTWFALAGDLVARDARFTARGSITGQLNASREPALHGDAQIAFDGTLGRVEGPPPRLQETELILNAALSPERAFDLKLSLPDGERPFFIVGGTPSAGALDLDAQADLSGRALKLVGALAGVPAGSGHVAATASAHLRWPPADPFVWQEVAVSVPTLTADWTSNDKTRQMNGIAGSAELEAGRLDARLFGTLVQRRDGRTIAAHLPRDYRVSYEQGRWSSGAGLRLDVTDGDNSAQATLRSLSFDRGTRSRLDADADIDARVGNVRAAGRLNAGAAIADESSGRVAFDGRVTVKGEEHDGELAATFALTQSVATLQGTVSTYIADDMPFELRYERASGAGTFGASHTFEFDSGAGAMLISDWQRNYDLDRGRVAATLDLDWAALDKVAARLTLDLSDTQAHYDAYRAAGIEGRLLLQADDAGDAAAWQLAPSTLKIAGVDVGIPIRDVDLGLAWSGDRVEVTQLAASVLGGRATAAAFTYNIAAGAAALDLDMSGIDLARVLALEGDDITGTGTLDGTLPLTINDNKPRIAGGTMLARPPGGRIRVSPKLSGTTALADLSFALNALADYQYTSLTTDIDYAENGDLKLGVHLQGRNPDVEKGRPIHYNLTISENVPVLLESLRLQDTFTEQIENKVKN